MTSGDGTTRPYAMIAFPELSELGAGPMTIYSSGRDDDDAYRLSYITSRFEDLGIEHCVAMYPRLLRPGDRVTMLIGKPIFRREIGEGMKGTVVSAGAELVDIHLDTYCSDLDEWGNRLLWTMDDVEGYPDFISGMNIWGYVSLNVARLEVGV